MKINLILLGSVMATHPNMRRKRQRVETPSPTTTSTTTTAIPPFGVYYNPFMRGPLFPLLVAPGLHITGVTHRGRFVEFYDSNRVAATYGADMVRILREQLVLDDRHDLFTPATQRNDFIQNTPYGELAIGHPIARSGESTVFTLPQLPGFLIKFQANCNEIWDHSVVGDTVVHPLILDTWYGHEASRIDLSMAPNFVSPPAALCRDMDGICKFRGMSLYDYHHCRAHGGSIRYMIIKKSMGFSLGTAARNYGGSMPLKTVFDLGVTMMYILQKLHVEAKIVHGDIHAENVFLEPLGVDERFGVKFIDFGRASRVVPVWPELPRVDRDELHPPYQFTQWMNDGYHWTQRDDVMKTIQMLTHLMYNEYEYIRIEKHYMQMGNAAQKEFKINHDLFFPITPWNQTNRLDAVSPLKIPEENKIQIRTELAHILGLVRGLNSTNSVIPYAELRESFRRCSQLVTIEDTN